MSDQTCDVVIIGGGPAGLSAAVFTARNDLDTVVVEDGYSILRRNAHLENFLGFPAGVNSRLLLQMGQDQAVRSGAEYIKDTVVSVSRDEDAFMIETQESRTLRCEYVISASWANVFQLEELDVDTYTNGSKTFIETDADGRTSVEGIYAAGRITGKRHQTIISAGHGAEVATALIEDHNPDFYHDWVAPEGYFTGRGREVPEGIEEIPEEERRRREQESLDLMQEYFSDLYPETPHMHPKVKKEEKGK